MATAFITPRSTTILCTNLARHKSIHELEKLIVHFASHQLLFAVLVNGIQEIT